MEARIIPPWRLQKGYRQLVHVLGWPRGCVFRYLGTDPDGTHHLETPKTRRKHETKESLTFTDRNS